MKKYVSVFLVLAMVLAMLPMAVYAAGPYDLSVGFAQYIDLYADDTVTLNVPVQEQDVVLTVNGEGTYYDWYIDNGMQQFIPEINGAYSLKLQAGTAYELVLVSDTMFDDQMLYVTLTAPKLGSEQNPAQLNMGEDVVELDGNAGYYYSFTATEAGKLEIAIDTDKTAEWSYQLVKKLTNGTTSYGDTHFSDEDPLVSSDEMVVQAGDVVIVYFDSLYWYVPTTIYFNASFTAGEFGGEGEGEGEGGGVGVIGSGDISVTDAPSADDEPWTYTFNAEGPGSLRIVIGECNPGWRYKITYPNGETSLYFSASAWSVGPDYTHELTDAGEYKVEIWAYDAANYENVDGTISASITYTAQGGEVEVPKEEYIVSDVLLGLGENSLTMIENAITTIYEFSPDETGVYKFSIDDNSALVGYWGAGSFFVWDQTENKTNSVEKELNAVGQSIMVGVSGIEGDFIMTVEKLGAAEEIEDIEYIDYVVKHVPMDSNLVDTTDVNVNNVDITKDYNIVKDEKGFYHLGSVDGPVLYVNLTSEGFDIINAFFGGYGAMTMRGQYTAEDGTVTNYEFISAMRNYATVVYNSDYDNGLYPLTEDLMIFLKAFGTNQGWYNPNQTSFEAIKADHEADSAWLVTCCYLGEVYEEPEIPENPENPEENPGLGDYSIAALVVSMMAATAGAVILTKKKEF